MNLTPLITAAGLRAVINATNDGIQAKIVSIALGDAAWSPEQSATSLENERARVPITGSTRVNPTQIHVTAIEDGEVEYWVREIGFYLEDGTLLAIWSQPDVDRPLAYKAAAIDLLLGFDLVLSALPIDSIVIEDTGGLNLGPATDSVAGVVRFATEEEALQGQLNDVAMSPARTAELFDEVTKQLVAATEEEPGLVQFATDEEALEGERDDRVMSPAKTALLFIPATREERGVVRMATPEQALAGLNDQAAMTPRMSVALGDDRYKQRLTFGAVQLTGFINNFDELVDYTVPAGTIIVGLLSIHDNRTEDRRFRVRYQSIHLDSGPRIVR